MEDSEAEVTEEVMTIMRDALAQTERAGSLPARLAFRELLLAVTLPEDL